MKLRRFIASWLLLIPFVCMGQETDSLTLAQQDSLAITESDDFVKASILVATPSNVLYSCVGHASIRMQCPYHDLDVVYSYEADSVTEKILTFFRGKLTMGMAALPLESVLADYGKDGRGIVEYPLNLPLDSRKQLWKYLDERVKEGTNLPYDYLNRSCALACLRAIQGAILPDTLSFGKWDDRIVRKTRRTLLGDRISEFPWNRFVIFSIAGTEADRAITPINKVVLPADLIDVLQNTTFSGQPVLGDANELLCQIVETERAGMITPVVVACALLLLAFVSCFWLRRSLSFLLLALQSFFGLSVTYLIFFSELPVTDFSWLLIPFNPLPLLLWYWRRWWLLPFGLVCCVWSIVMLAHRENPLVDPAHIILVFALAVNYIGQWYQIRKTNQLKQIKR